MKRKSEKPKSEAAAEIVVFSVVRETQCTECGTDLLKGGLLRLEGEKALCTGCADLGHLEFLPSGDAALTRRASKYSTLRAVVVRWSRGASDMSDKASWSSPRPLFVPNKNHQRMRKSARSDRREPPNDGNFLITNF